MNGMHSDRPEFSVGPIDRVRQFLARLFQLFQGPPRAEHPSFDLGGQVFVCDSCLTEFPTFDSLVRHRCGRAA